MRQIEKKLTNAIRTKAKAWHEGNTMVSYNENTETYDVFLHGHRIAVIDYKRNVAKISSCNYRTQTTKSRLNTILNALYTGECVRQVNGCWKLSRVHENDFYDGIEVSF